MAFLIGGYCTSLRLDAMAAQSRTESVYQPALDELKQNPEHDPRLLMENMHILHSFCTLCDHDQSHIMEQICESLHSGIIYLFVLTGIYETGVQLDDLEWKLKQAVEVWIAYTEIVQEESEPFLCKFFHNTENLLEVV